MGEHRLKGLLNPEHLWQLVAPDVREDFPPLQSLNAILNNLPVQLTSFIGREKDIAEVKQLLSISRLVTLTGSGGAGKTRLSLQVAAEVIDAFDHGVWFIDLAPLSDSAIVPNTVLSTLGLRDEAGRAPPDVLTDFLHARKVLLILDNCEHLIQACAQLAYRLLTHCPQVRILATSREALDVAGEIAYHVPSLALPDPQHLPSLEALSQYDAVRLFIERAAAVQSQFAVTNSNAPAVAQICYRLDGIPLAIELAAARIKLFSPEQIASRLDDRFQLLASGSRTALPRQQTLRAAIDWSYSLLSDAERILFRRLAVFAGGWTFEAVEAVCSGEGLGALDVLELLGHLVDKSLVTTNARGDETRYRMLETLREYAFDKLRDAGETESVRSQHRNYFRAFADLADSQPPAEKVPWQNRLELEHDNLRAALRWALEQNEGEQALALCNALSGFWMARGYWTESRMWNGQAIAASRQLQATTPISEAHRVLYGIALDECGSLAVWQGDYVTAREQLNEALAIKHEFGDKGGIASVLFSLAGLALYQNDPMVAQATLEEALGLYREVGNKIEVAGLHLNLALLAKERGDYDESRRLTQESLTYNRELNNNRGTAWALENLAWLAMIAGDYAKSQQLAEESLSLRQEVQDKFSLAWGFTQKGYVAWHQGDCRTARVALREALALFQSLGTSSFNTCPCLTGFALVDVTEGHLTRGTQLLGAIQAENERTGRYNKDIFLTVYNKALDIAQVQLDADSFNTAWATGHAMTMAQAMQLALSNED
jgi:predicted ATPase